MRSFATSSLKESWCAEKRSDSLEPMPEKSLAAQRIPEQADRPVLQVAVEIDEHIAAGHELHFGKYTVGGQAVIRKDDVLAQRLVENGPAVRGRVVIGQ